MMEKDFSNDVAKELFTILSYCENSFINNIPDSVLKNLNAKASESTKDFYIDKTKSLEEQNISEECQDLLSILYFTYMADSSYKKDILSKWAANAKEKYINS